MFNLVYTKSAYSPSGPSVASKPSISAVGHPLNLLISLKWELIVIIIDRLKACVMQVWGRHSARLILLFISCVTVWLAPFKELDLICYNLSNITPLAILAIV
jgi:hypothetical protein